MKTLYIILNVLFFMSAFSQEKKDIIVFGFDTTTDEVIYRVHKGKEEISKQNPSVSSPPVENLSNQHIIFTPINDMTPSEIPFTGLRTNSASDQMFRRAIQDSEQLQHPYPPTVDVSSQAYYSGFPPNQYYF